MPSQDFHPFDDPIKVSVQVSKQLLLLNMKNFSTRETVCEPETMREVSGLFAMCRVVAAAAGLC